MKTKICVFDDSNHIRESLQLLFSSIEDIELTAMYPDATDVVKKVEKSGAAVVIMDIELPGIDGIQSVTSLRKKFPGIFILMFTVSEDDDKIFRSICAGANGYLLKKTEPMNIVQAIREVQSGGAPMSPAIAKRVLQKFSEFTPAAPAADYFLTPREKEVLKLLTQGLSYKMIADSCNISFETVRSHIKNIYDKLHVASMTEAVAKALKENII